GLEAVNELEARMAELRHIEADLETIRQAHYAAGDQVNQAQGKLYEATAEVGRLEAEIRYVVEGRQRVEQRLAQLAEQIDSWGQRRDDAEIELEQLAGQGTISRIIESRPEELRLFLEEAAGVSKYKERRRETENRLSGTRENLTRVEDILRELNGNLEKLEKQAEVAAQYNALHASVTLKQQQLWFLKRADAEAEMLAAQLEEQSLQLPDLEDAHRNAQTKANEQRQQVVQVQQQIQVLAAEQRSTSEQTRQLESRHERLRTDRNALAAPDDTRVNNLRQQYEEAAEMAEMAEAALVELQDSVPQLDEDRRQRQQTLNQESARQADLSARMEALKALQEKVKTDGKLQPWLAKHGLDSLQGLWSRLHVEPGWENALEAALRERMGALEVGRLDMVRGFLGAGGQDAPPARLAFYNKPAVGTAAASSAGNSQRLSDLLRVQDAGLQAVLVDWLTGCQTAQTLDEALNRRAALQPGETIYVPTGHAVTAHSVSFYAQDSEQSGLLARAQEIEHLEKELRAQALIHEEARMALARAESAYADASQRLVTARREATEAKQSAHELQVESLRLTQLAEQARARTAQLDADLGEVTAQLEELQERTVAAEARFEELDMQLADSQERHAQLDERVIECERKVAECREQQRTLERRAQEATFSQRSVEARKGELQRTMETAVQQAKALGEERERALAEQGRLNDPAAQGGLQDALNIKMEREQALGACRSQYDDLTNKLRASDERRTQLERGMEPLRGRITEFQLKEQAARLGVEQFEGLLTEAQADLAAVAQSIAEGNVRLHGLQGDIERLHRDIAALGAVNLAALEELQIARERKTFLDAQMDDLTRAMTTLEDAIKKIDAETRQLLSGTFDTVNRHFGRMFPELFGGGQAKLIITGDEILDSGVQVMAQPPGKKNQTIHLLSGGEKALTAIALVFAIFQLNPAPFCLLDEVDAPLDDANTERYAKLVASMSTSTQFLFISHNKIAMEMAQQLIGVTMQEQGVSRIVAVDMESALSMADA
ncbi:MAG: chromosome segregation protein SMC, partial [Acidovorax sp.]|nr:chromosome segregation protein SMC [Acidovorax sp.]